jgi:DNA-binding response OmpR family regulator
MDIDSLKKLQLLAKNMSLLYIENDTNLQEQIKTNFNHLFLNVYQAFDGEDGLKQYETYKPDVVISTLTMPKIDGIETISSIISKDEDTKILVLCDDNEDLELLQTLDMDIVGILIKPFDIYKLIDMLLKGITTKLSKDEISCFKDLRNICQIKEKIDLVNYYKGIPVKNKALIIEANNNELTIKVTKIQLIAIKYENDTIIQINSTNKYIRLVLLNIDQNQRIITVTKCNYFDYESRDIKNKRVLIDKSFKIGLRYKSKTILAESLDISFTGISMISDKPCDDCLKVDDEVDLTIGFKVKAKNSLIQSDLITKVFAKGKIIRVVPHLDQIKITATIEVEKSSQSTFIKYLKQREIETILELRKLVNS